MNDIKNRKKRKKKKEKEKENVLGNYFWSSNYNNKKHTVCIVIQFIGMYFLIEIIAVI